MATAKDAARATRDNPAGSGWTLVESRASKVASWLGRDKSKKS